MARISDMPKKWMKEPKYKKAYDALEEELVLAGPVMVVRNRAGLPQEELARRMGTTEPVVARLESGRTCPSMQALERLAEATGSRLLNGFGRATRSGPRVEGGVRVSMTSSKRRKRRPSRDRHVPHFVARNLVPPPS
ncbi:MAG: helix-turn-helix transcriptional regulator [Bryobacteraceae bacterium]|jgi:ribosome-binding protein aMBF1 (putative translation factor)